MQLDGAKTLAFGARIASARICPTLEQIAGAHRLMEQLFWFLQNFWLLNR